MSEEKNVVECSKCRHFDLIDEEMQVGHCLRYAPRPRAMPPEDAPPYFVSWPHVFCSYRCGEFEPK